MRQDIVQRPIEEFLLFFPEDGNIIKNYPTCTSWAINEHNCLILYKNKVVLTILNNFDRGSNIS
jgi:hypothetical protein